MRKSRYLARRGLIASAIGISAAIGNVSVLHAQNGPKTWESFDFAHRRVDSAAVTNLPLSDLRLLRGIVFGRHGRPFTDEPDIQTYLRARPWYHADTAFSNKRLSATERANLDVIR